MGDTPAWVIIVIGIQAILLTGLLVMLARGRGWTKLRVGFFAERELLPPRHREQEPDDGDSATPDADA